MIKFQLCMAQQSVVFACQGSCRGRALLPRGPKTAKDCTITSGSGESGRNDLPVATLPARRRGNTRLGRITEQASRVMLVTVAICAFNRAVSLGRTLDSLTAIQVPSDITWELVIVNNNSTDHTDDAIREYSDRLPIRREFEPRPGKSNALNRAIDVAKGDYILWTDDDVVVDAGWLRAYVDAFRRWPEAAVFGGRIVPKYEPPVARWVLESEDSTFCVYAIRNFGDNVQPLSIAEDRLPFGANYAIRAAEQRAFRYDPNLGPVPHRHRRNEETDVITRLLKSGATGYWIPNAVVEHCIGRERQTVRYIADFFVGDGETYAFQNADTTAATPFLFGIPRRVWPRLIVWGSLYHLHRLVSPAPIC
jgi:glycosyltransferase involved in cell wall biosynthesis